MKAISEFRKKLGVIACSSWFSSLFLFVMLLIWHARIHPFGDDLYFAAVWEDEGYGLIEFLSMRYQRWSSRVWIEFILICMSRWIWLWKVLNSLVITGIARACARLLGGDRDAALNWGLCALVMLIPVGVLNSAGWIATTVNYAWPAFCALLALIPLRRALCQERLKAYEAGIAVIAVAFAANHEQYCVALLALLLIGTVTIVLQQKRVPPLCVLELLITLSNLILILRCPGNQVRYSSEIGTWFPQYGALSLWEKAEIGFSATGYSLIMRRNLIFVAFAILLAISVWSQRKDFVSRIIGVIPFATSVLMGVFPELFAEFFPNIANLRNALTETGTGFDLHYPGTMIPDLFLGAVFLCVVCSMFMCLHREKAWMMLFVLLICLGTKMMMGFSPTVWASGDRTGLPLMTGLIWMSGMLIQEITRRAGERAGVRIMRTGEILVFLCMLERILYW